MLRQTSYKRINVALRDAFGAISARRIVGQALLRSGAREEGWYGDELQPVCDRDGSGAKRVAYASADFMVARAEFFGDNLGACQSDQHWRNLRCQNQPSWMLP
jgi:hypothetical protein